MNHIHIHYITTGDEFQVVISSSRQSSLILTKKNKAKESRDKVENGKVKTLSLSRIVDNNQPDLPDDPPHYDSVKDSTMMLTSQTLFHPSILSEPFCSTSKISEWQAISSSMRMTNAVELVFLINCTRLCHP